MAREYSTRAKSKIMAYLEENKDKRFSANDVYADLVKSGEDINLATVYRNLEKLTEDGSLIKAKSVENNACFYQYAGECHECHEHIHMQCKNCGRIIHMECDFMENISGHLLKHHGFKLDCEGSVIMGLCDRCRMSPKKGVLA